MTAAEARAPAKVNLTLHVTGRRPDGYHLLDSLVVFADAADVVRVRPADAPALRVTGPMAAGVPTDSSNLVLRAAALMGVTAEIELEKHLPPAGGIGGGSSDAAATLRALSRMTGRPLPREVLALGADVPVCMEPRPMRMRGIGETLSPVDGLPALDAVLVNPGIAVPTPQVFARLDRRANAPMPERFPTFPDAAAFADWLAGQRNDLERPAQTIAPEVGAALAALAQADGCRLARMSGSGATCFGLFPDSTSAARAARALARPGWWVRAVRLGAQ
ncbi:4-(cytidine 5'-diphospho)-2-C-methyl-D-erythritol kinase [Rhodosalinus halophilus]|uniref:4-diphosphocytidyl-2-C-methyl-D-erythritol kinase n=1 Tax=Rhodosalinus halophilus TaxID=2259333 RepID=A0A365U9L5_9RHOB|nr:4-(cytidine 5'-diphospho)-2-C-methyl-D-erythritol kinase [Rhodosalinus halophilus]RBI85733.1 4-(cytidine 5'-diphospho)-2-C-methyl-D-erythritol kinase [Rhodosalinus halophilus]